MQDVNKLELITLLFVIVKEHFLNIKQSMNVGKFHVSPLCSLLFFAEGTLSTSKSISFDLDRRTVCVAERLSSN